MLFLSFIAEWQALIARVLSIRQIEVQDTIPLRHSVLWPEQDISYVSLPEDAEGYHFGAFLPPHDKPISIISLFLAPLPQTEDSELLSNYAGAARFRKFACDPAYQGRKFISK